MRVVARSVSPQTSITGSFLSYSAPGRGAEYCDERICVSVYLSLYDHIFGTARPIFTKFFMLVTNGRGSVLLWRRISDFMDDVIFAHKPRLFDVAARLRQ